MIGDNDVLVNLIQLNNRPRKKISYKTPFEIMSKYTAELAASPLSLCCWICRGNKHFGQENFILTRLNLATFCRIQHRLSLFAYKLPTQTFNHVLPNKW